VGNLAAWNYFESVDNPTNQAFVADYKAYAKAHKLPNADTVVTNDPMEATYVGIHMWAQAVKKPAPPMWIKCVRRWPGNLQSAVRFYADHGCHQPSSA
jgi:ABC-type branched-subunit amino acid transport system substrate-binding protein